MLALLALAVLTAVPAELYAGGNPIPTCGSGYCIPPG
jgi:hypothetical protein